MSVKLLFHLFFDVRRRPMPSDLDVDTPDHEVGRDPLQCTGRAEGRRGQDRCRGPPDAKPSSLDPSATPARDAPTRQGGRITAQKPLAGGRKPLSASEGHKPPVTTARDE